MSFARHLVFFVVLAAGCSGSESSSSSADSAIDATSSDTSVSVIDSAIDTSTATDSSTASEVATDSGSDGASCDASTTFVDAGACTKTWKVLASPEVRGTATVEGGAAVLRLFPACTTGGFGPRTVYNNSAVALSQSALTGDFVAELTFDAFTFSKGAVGQLGVWFHDTDGRIYQAVAGVGDDGVAGVHAAFVGTTAESMSTPITGLSGSSGTLRIERTGTSLTVTASAKGVTRTVSSTAFAYGPLQLYAGLGAPDYAKLDAPATWTISKVTVTGGGGTVVSDAFDADSLCTPTDGT